jgi:hypothetical protein
MQNSDTAADKPLPVFKKKNRKLIYVRGIVHFWMQNEPHGTK